MFLDVFHLRAFSDEETVDTVVFTVLRSAVIDTAARDDHDIGSFSDIKVVINELLDSARCHDDRDMDTLILCARLDLNVDAGTVLLRDDVDIRRRVSRDGFTIGADVICADRHLMQISNFF